MSSDDHFRTGGAFEEFGRIAESLGHSDPLVGQLAGRYRIEGLIAEGGMGRVYLGSRMDGQFQRSAAIKVLPAGFGRERLRRFAQEREILARLSHRNIAQLFDAGEADWGGLFLVMELVEGVAIDQYVDRFKLDVRDLTRLMLTLCEALAFAHARLVVHRDLKPSNVFVSDAGDLKLLDFGIAKILESADDLTADSRPLTPRYASPEQLRGEPASVASDIYQLGLLFADLLRRERDVPGNSAAMAMEHAFKGVSFRADSIVGATLPADLAAIIDQCLRADPAERYGSAGELAADLASFLGGFPVRARNPGAVLRAAKFLRRNWLQTAVVALSGVFVASSSAYYLYSLTQQRDAVVAANAAARGEAEIANSVTDFLLNMISGANVLYTPEEPQSVREAVIKGAGLLTTELREEPVVRARVAGELAGVLNTMGEWAAARSLLDSVLPGLSNRSEVGFEQIWQLRSHAAYATYRLSEFDSARRQFGDILSTFEDAGLTRHPIYADAWRRLALLERRAGNHELALEHIQRAEQAYRFHDGNKAVLADFLNHYGLVQNSLRHFDAAIAAYRRSIALFRELQGDDCPRCAIVQTNLTESLRKTGRLEEALGTILQAKTQYQRALGDGIDYWRGPVLIELASISNKLGRYDEAIDYHRQADAHYRSMTGDRSSLYALSLRNHALSHRDHGRCDLAIPLLEAAQGIHRELFGEGSAHVERNERHISECGGRDTVRRDLSAEVSAAGEGAQD